MSLASIVGTFDNSDSVLLLFHSVLPTFQFRHAPRYGFFDGGLLSQAHYRTLVKLHSSVIPVSNDYTGFRVIVQRLAIATAVNGGTLQACRVLPANDWIEGVSGNQNPAQVDECCWDSLRANGAGGVIDEWAGAPTDRGCGVAGVDYDDTTIASTAYAAYTSGPNVPVTMNLNPVWLPLWLVTNDGFVVKAQDETRWTALNLFRAGDYAGTAPVFEIDFVAGGGLGAMMLPF